MSFHRSDIEDGAGNYGQSSLAGDSVPQPNVHNPRKKTKKRKQPQDKKPRVLPYQKGKRTSPGTLGRG